MTDALVKVLNSIGYQPVFMPRTGITPPEVYNFANGRLIRRGHLSQYLMKEITLPQNRQGKLGDIEHKETSGKKLSAATSFLENALRCIGVTSPPKIDLSFAGGSEFTFSFSDVTYVGIDPSELDLVLNSLSIGAIPQEYVEGGRLHIAYEYAYANTLLMRRADNKKFETTVSGVQIEMFINVGTSGVVEAQSETTLSFKNSTANGGGAAFAYKAGQLKLDNGKWAFFPEEVMTDSFLGDEGAYLPARGVVLKVQEA